MPLFRIGLASGAFLCMGFVADANIGIVRAQSDQLDLSNYTMTFDDEFDSLSVSSRSPGKTWIAHTPWNGDFGSSIFTDPSPDFPFTIKDGILRIELRKGTDGKWRSGLLSSRSGDGPSAQGFAQQYGYFEIRTKLPGGPGTWPAFWLIGVDRSKYTAEIDIMEQYGAFPTEYHLGAQVHGATGAPKTIGTTKSVSDNLMFTQFNTYGVLIDENKMTYYFNRQPIWSTPTADEFRQPMYLLMDLGLGGGWPIDKAPNPSEMYVDYVKVFKKKQQ